MRRVPLLLHPALLVALGVWLLNDHVLKAAFHAEWTGKLSDVASLVAFPLLAAGGMALVRGRERGRHEWPAVLAWSLATGLVMATINTLPGAAWAYRHGLGLALWLALGAEGAVRPVRLWMDPTDLFTLPALIVPLAIAWRRRDEPRPECRLSYPARRGHEAPPSRQGRQDEEHLGALGGSIEAPPSRQGRQEEEHLGARGGSMTGARRRVRADIADRRFARAAR